MTSNVEQPAGSTPYRSADIAHRFGAKDQRGASVHREVARWLDPLGIVDSTPSESWTRC
jgi:hypothetical protein